FPGETEQEFEELVEFVRQARFERAGVFPYSFEPGTPATRLDGHLPEEVKTARRDRLMEAQQEVAFAWARGQVGKEVEAIVDGPAATPPRRTSTAWSASRAGASAPGTWRGSR